MVQHLLVWGRVRLKDPAADEISFFLRWSVELARDENVSKACQCDDASAPLRRDATADGLHNRFRKQPR